MSATLVKLLLQQSEGGEPAILWGRLAKPHLGREFDSLLGQRILIEEAPAESWSICSNCECGFDARPIQHINGRLVAACPIDAGSDAVLEPDDLRSFRIDVAVLMRTVASASGFDTEPGEIIKGVWHFGPIRDGRALFVASSVPAALQPGLVASLRMAVHDQPITLAAPELPAVQRQKMLEADTFLVCLQDVIARTGRTPFALDFSKLAPSRAARPRLVIRKSAKLVQIDGASRLLPDQPFELLTLLAERALTDDPFVAPREIEDLIWGTLVHRVSRPARDVVRELRDALAAGSSDPGSSRDLIENQRNRGWRLALTPSEIDLRD